MCICLPLVVAVAILLMPSLLLIRYFLPGLCAARVKGRIWVIAKQISIIKLP